MYKYIIKHAATLALFVSPFMLQGGEAENKAAEELLEVCQFEKMMDSSIDSAVQMLTQIDSAVSAQEDRIREFYKKYMTAESLRQEVVKLYADVFTKKELEEMIAFYKSSTGQKALEKLPELMQRSMQIAQSRLMQNMGELQKMLSEIESSTNNRSNE